MFLRLLLLFVVPAVLLWSEFGEAQTVNVLGPKRYFVTSGSQSTYTETIARTTNQMSFPHKLIVKNADGQVREPRNCSGLGFVARLLCQIQNAVDNLYTNIFKVDSAVITWNGQVLTTAQTFTQNTTVLEFQLPLQANNQLNIQINGNVLSYIDVTLQASETEEQDTLAPTVMANIEPWTYTNDQDGFHISITDASNVTTEVYHNGMLQSTQTTKEFDLYLVEGANTYVLKAHDQHGNQAEDFVLNDITLDTYNPVLELYFPETFYVTSFPATLNFEFVTNEELSSFKIDGQEIDSDTWLYTYQKTVTQADGNQIVVEATDLAGNTNSQTISLNVVQDTSAPNILLSGFDTYTNQDSATISVEIQDQSPVATELWVNGDYWATIHETNFSYWFNLTEPGEYHIMFIATDSAGNSNTQNVTIVKDSSPLALTMLAPLQGNTYTSQSIVVQFSANHPLAAAYVNDVSVPIETSGNSVNYLYESAFDGDFTVNVRAVDTFGNEVTASVSATIQLGGNALWTYEECPAE